MTDPIDDLVARLRALEPPAERPDLRAALLAEFDREAASRRRARRAPRFAVAAALLLASVALLFVRRPDPVAGESDVAKLERKLDRLLARADALESRVEMHVDDAPERLEIEGPLAEQVAPVLASAGDDPGLLRLMSARLAEGFDPDLAVAHYRAILETYPASPAASAARARLDVIDR